MRRARGKKLPPRAHRRRRGHAYVEVLVATILLAVALVPALEALRDGLRAAAVEEQLAVQQHRLVARLEEVAAEPFVVVAAETVAAAGAPSAYSDAPATPGRRVVTLFFHDANGDATGEPDLIRVRVALENTPHVFETLVSP